MARTHRAVLPTSCRYQIGCPRTDPPCRSTIRYADELQSFVAAYYKRTFPCFLARRELVSGQEITRKRNHRHRGKLQRKKDRGLRDCRPAVTDAGTVRTADRNAISDSADNGIAGLRNVRNPIAVIRIHRLLRDASPHTRRIFEHPCKGPRRKQGSTNRSRRKRGR